jgi:hypothetical protein
MAAAPSCSIRRALRQGQEFTSAEAIPLPAAPDNLAAKLFLIVSCTEAAAAWQNLIRGRIAISANRGEPRPV